MKNIYDVDTIKQVYDMKDIDRMLERYREMMRAHLADPENYEIPPSCTYGVRKDIFNCTAEMFMMEYHNEFIHDITYKQFIRCMTIFRSYCRDPHDIEVVNKLIGDKKLFTKMIFVTDGSYRLNRIWFDSHISNPDKPHFEVNDRKYFLMKKSISDSDYWKHVEESRNSPARAIQKMFNDYPIIFMQIPLKETMSSLEELIAWDAFIYDMDDPEFD